MSLDRTRLKVRAFERRRQRAGEDVCSLYAPIVAEGGSSGDSVTPQLVPAATGLECVYRGSGQNSQVVVGGRSYLASHEIELERTALTAAITPEYQIKVAPRTGRAEMVFEQPVIVEQPFNPVLKLAATQVIQGYQQ